MTDYLDLNIYSRKCFNTRESAVKLLETICLCDEFTPDRYGWFEPIRKPFSRENMEGAIEALLNEQGNEFEPDTPNGMVLLKRTKKPKCYYSAEWSRYKHFPFEVSCYSIEVNYVKKPSNLEKWLDLNNKLINIHEAWFASITLFKEEMWKNRLIYVVPKGAKDEIPGSEVQSFVGTKLNEGIPGIYWGNYFNKFYVDWLGREKFETLPCIRKEYFPDGSVFFTTAEYPWDWDTEECRKLQRQVMEHLGKEAFFDMETFRQTVKEKLGKNGITDPEKLLPKVKTPKFPF
ncbi:MAG: hypothetical protein M0Z31_03930 [Clostridia bacterium]|nr:hypothetical protein [Clostridia bacterium]